MSTKTGMTERHRGRAHMFENFEPRKVREFEIQEDKIGDRVSRAVAVSLMTVEVVHRLSAVGDGLKGEVGPGLLEFVLEEKGVVGIVLDQKQV